MCNPVAVYKAALTKCIFIKSRKQTHIAFYANQIQNNTETDGCIDTVDTFARSLACPSEQHAVLSRV
jgi:hypothetical protein